MLKESEKQLILSQGYVPEHSVDLMVLLSRAEPGMSNGFFFCSSRDLLILVGYPIGRPFEARDLEKVIFRLTERFKPMRISLIAPELPTRVECRAQETDEYYILPLTNHGPRPGLIRQAEQASETVRFERSQTFTQAHEDLVQEIIGRAVLPSKVEALFTHIAAFVMNAQAAWVLNAWTDDSKLSAFYVIDLTPTHFSIYVIGGHSKRHYVPWASDLLFHKMIELSKDHDKASIHLGLGVNQGIRQFKKKWGGVPFLPYHSCDIMVRGPSFLESIYSFLTS